MKQKGKILIVDDNEEILFSLEIFLEKYFEKIVSLNSPELIKQRMSEEEFDVFLLDMNFTASVQSGNEGMFWMKEILKIDPEASIIFITAFDEYAIRAFEVNALDYLLKPITSERLQRAIERVQVEQEQEALPRKKLRYDDRLFTNFDSKLHFLKISSILKIAAAGDYTELFLKDGKKGLTLKSMKEWEGRLPENNFCRIHRSSIINMEYIDRMEEWFNYSYRIYMKGSKDPLLLSRRYVAKLKSRMG